ncbi:MAG: hypothetical protein SGI77_21750 [Pirellulaceae bacterium]|nr:hypothetical protein [Pirellulaceae bacterium]
MKIIAILLICLLLVSSLANAEEVARLRYSTVAELAALEFASIDGIESQRLRLSVRSRNPDVKLRDIVITMKRAGKSEIVAVESDGTFVIPISEQLRIEDPWIESNQPKGSMHMKLSYSLKLAPPQLEDFGTEVRFDYAKMFPTEQVRTRIRKATNKMDQEAVRVFFKGEFVENAVLSCNDKQSRVAIHLKENATAIEKDTDGRFRIHLDPALLNGDAKVSLFPKSDWTFSVELQKLKE